MPIRGRASAAPMDAANATTVVRMPIRKRIMPLLHKFRRYQGICAMVNPMLANATAAAAAASDRASVPERRTPLSAPACVETSAASRSEEHTSELQSLMPTSYAVFCLKKKKNKEQHYIPITT